jgi:hypothetical protein
MDSPLGVATLPEFCMKSFPNVLASASTSPTREASIESGFLLSNEIPEPFGMG